jgi:hypothetical protein
VHHVLGCNIEITATRGVDNPVLTTNQPEWPLQLPLRILRDVRAAHNEIGAATARLWILQPVPVDE